MVYCNCPRCVRTMCAMPRKHKNRRGYEGYKRRAGDGRDVILCSSCNVSVAARSMTRHKAGVLHRQSKRIQALLAKPCLTLESIAKRVGVTRERVRQISLMVGVQCGPRRNVCIVQRVTKRNHGPNKQRINSGLLKGVIEACDGREWRVETLPMEGGLIRTHAVRINGALCHLSLATTKLSGYVTLRRPRDPNVQFILYQLPDNRWMVVPIQSAPKTSTSIAPTLTERGKRVLTKKCRHDWRNYIDAWHLLATKQESVAA